MSKSNENTAIVMAKALFAIATAIEKLADAIRERPIVISHEGIAAAEVAK